MPAPLPPQIPAQLPEQPLFPVRDVPAFAERVRKWWPGGRWVSEHVADGPYRLVAVRDLSVGDEEPKSLVAGALSTFGSVRLPWPTPAGDDDLEEAAVHVLPEFVYQLIDEVGNDATSVSYDCEYQFEQYPGVEQVAETLAEVYNTTEDMRPAGEGHPGLAAAIVTAINALGLVGAGQLLLSLEPDRTPAEQLAAAITGALAPAGDSQTTTTAGHHG